MNTLNERLVATTADGFVCGTLWSGLHDQRGTWTVFHHAHGCTVSTIPADETLPGVGQRWTPPIEREATS